jgi:hypothetical protein
MNTRDIEKLAQRLVDDIDDEAASDVFFEIGERVHIIPLAVCNNCPLCGQYGYVVSNDASLILQMESGPHAGENVPVARRCVEKAPVSPQTACASDKAAEVPCPNASCRKSNYVTDTKCWWCETALQGVKR